MKCKNIINFQEIKLEKLMVVKNDLRVTVLILMISILLIFGDERFHDFLYSFIL